MMVTGGKKNLEKIQHGNTGDIITMNKKYTKKQIIESIRY